MNKLDPIPQTPSRFRLFLNKKSPRLYLIIILAFLVLITTWIYFASKNKTSDINQLINRSPFAKLFKPQTPSSSSPSPSPSATPIPLTPGPGTYNISQGQHTGPTVSQVTFDPLDVNKGQLLTITVKVLAKTPADKVTASLQTDSSTKNLTFDKISSDESYQTWTARLKLSESVLYKYILTINLSSSQGKSQVIVAPRS